MSSPASAKPVFDISLNPGVSIGFDVVSTTSTTSTTSMTPDEWFELGLEFSGHISFLQAQGYTADEILEIASKKII